MANNDLAATLNINAQDNTGGAFNSALSSVAAFRNGVNATHTGVGNLAQSSSAAASGLGNLNTQSNAASGGLGALQNSAAGAFNQLKSFVGTWLGFEAGKEILSASDQFKDYKAKIELATRSAQEFAVVDKGIQEVSKLTQTELGTNAALYQRSAQSMYDMGRKAEEVTRLVDINAKALKISGASAAESSSATLQLSQSLASGVMRGEEFNAVNEAAPRIMQALRDSLGVTAGELRNMAEAGKLSSEVVINALMEQGAAIDAEFAQIGPRVKGSITEISNAFMLYVGEADALTGASDKVIGALKGIASALDGKPVLFNTLSESVGNFVDKLVTLDNNLPGLNFSKTLGLIKEGLTNVLPAMLDHQNQFDKLKNSYESLEQSGATVSNRLKIISADTGITVKSVEDLDAAVKAGTLAFDAASGRYVVVSDHLKAVSSQTGLTVDSMEALNKKVADGAIAFDAASGKYIQSGVDLQELSARAGLAINSQDELKAAVNGGLLAFDAAKQTYVSTAGGLAEVSRATGENITSYAELQAAVTSGALAVDASSGSLRDHNGHLITFKTGSVEAGLAARAVAEGLRESTEKSDAALKSFNDLNVSSDELNANLKKLSDSDLKRYFEDLKGAVDAGRVSIEDADGALAAYASETLRRLGVDLKEVTQDTQNFAQQSVSAFQTYIQAAQPTAAQIDRLKAAIIETAKTSDDLTALGVAFGGIGYNLQEGEKSGEAFRAKVGDVNKELRQMSQVELAQAEQAARAAFAAGTMSLAELQMRLESIADQSLKAVGVGFADIKQTAAQFANEAVVAFMRAQEAGSYNEAQLKEIQGELVRTAKTSDDLYALRDAFNHIGVQIDTSTSKLQRFTDHSRVASNASNNVGISSNYAAEATNNLSGSANRAAVALDDTSEAADRLTGASDALTRLKTYQAGGFVSKLYQDDMAAREYLRKTEYGMQKLEEIIAWQNKNMLSYSNLDRMSQQIIDLAAQVKVDLARQAEDRVQMNAAKEAAAADAQAAKAAKAKADADTKAAEESKNRAAKDKEAAAAAAYAAQQAEYKRASEESWRKDLADAEKRKLARLQQEEVRAEKLNQSGAFTDKTVTLKLQNTDGNSVNALFKTEADLNKFVDMLKQQKFLAA